MITLSTSNLTFGRIIIGASVLEWWLFQLQIILSAELLLEDLCWNDDFFKFKSYFGRIIIRVSVIESMTICYLEVFPIYWWKYRLGTNDLFTRTTGSTCELQIIYRYNTSELFTVHANNALFTCLVPPNNVTYTRTIPANNVLFAGTVPVHNVLFERTVPAKKVYLKVQYLWRKFICRYSTCA